ncbi:MAG: helix-turn-helix transcriptional regulator [Clostridia bacterium]|nr:helix-turn-helix transcriptional regulator [Clostridia bacterium]
MDMETKIKENIKFYRKQLGLTQGQLAEKLQGKKSLISNYENGYSTPDIYTLCKLAEIFDVTLDELVEYKKETADKQ